MSYLKDVNCIRQIYECIVRETNLKNEGKERVYILGTDIGTHRCSFHSPLSDCQRDCGIPASTLLSPGKLVRNAEFWVLSQIFLARSSGIRV